MKKLFLFLTILLWSKSNGLICKVCSGFNGKCLGLNDYGSNQSCGGSCFFSKTGENSYIFELFREIHSNVILLDDSGRITMSRRCTEKIVQDSCRNSELKSTLYQMCHCNLDICNEANVCTCPETESKSDRNFASKVLYILVSTLVIFEN